MNQPLRIGLFTPAWPGFNTSNGITTAVYHLAVGLKEIGHHPVIIAQRQDAIDPQDIPLVLTPKNSTVWEKIKGRLKVPDVWDMVRGRQVLSACKEAVAKHNLDALIMEETHGWVGPIQDHLPIPVIATLHGPWFILSPLRSDVHTEADKRREKREALALKKVAGITAPSRNVLASMLDEVPALQKLPTTVIRNAFPCVEQMPPEPRPDGILFVGRFDQLKGADTLLKAFAAFAATTPNVGLTFVGPDNGITRADGSTYYMADALAALPKEVQARITFKGKQDSDTIAALRKTHPVAVVASQYENLNYSMLEAMSAGQALVSTRVGGPKEVLTEGETVLFVMPGQVDEMAAAFEKLFADDALRLQLSQNVRTLLKRDFSPQAVARQTAEFVSQLK